jgi:hypothetical protein
MGREPGGIGRAKTSEANKVEDFLSLETARTSITLVTFIEEYRRREGETPE